MSSWQHQLLSRIIRNGDINSVIQWGITADDFTMGETQGLFTQIISYYTMPEYAGSIWGPHALQQKFPTFMLCDDPSMTTDALCMEVRKDKVKLALKQLIRSAEDIIDVDPTAAVARVQEVSATLRNECTPMKLDVHIADSMARVWNNYCSAEKGEQIAVYPWPWHTLQEKTLGVRATDYIILYGRPKSMKSWVLCYIVAYIINVSFDYRILIYTKEMDADEMFERIGCVLSGVSYDNFVSGKMTPEERRNFYIIADMLHTLRKAMTVVCLSAQDVKHGQDTVAWLESKIERYKPHAVFVDGMYLMSDQSGAKKQHERVSNISRAMRQLILRRKVPVLATVQANREAAKNEEANTEEIAFSDSLGQDATMLIRVINEWKKEKNTLALVMGAASRRYRLPGLRIYGEPATNFSYFGELSAKDAATAMKNDTGEDSGGGGKKPRPVINGSKSKKKDEEAASRAADDLAEMVDA